MNDIVHWVLEVEVKPGCLDGFLTLMTALIEVTRQETGALSYEWTFNEDKTVCCLYERYRTSEDALIHLASFDAFETRFLDLCVPVNFTVMGKPSEALRAKLAPDAPSYRTFEAGFHKAAVADH